MLVVAAVSGAVIARFWPEPDGTPQATTDLTERLAALETRFSPSPRPPNPISRRSRRGSVNSKSG